MTWQHVSLGGVVTSLASLGLLLLLHTVSRPLRTHPLAKYKIPLYLCVLLHLQILLLQEVLLVVPPPDLCLPLALLCQYLHLASYSLLPAMALHLHLSFRAKERRPTSCTSWLFLASSLAAPLLLTTTTLCLPFLRADNITLVVADITFPSCSLTTSPSRLFYLDTPILLLLLLTCLIFYCLIVHHLSQGDPEVLRDVRVVVELVLVLLLAWLSQAGARLVSWLRPSLHPATRTLRHLPLLQGLLLLVVFLSRRHSRLLLCSRGKKWERGDPGCGGCSSSSTKPNQWVLEEEAAPGCGHCDSIISLPSPPTGVPGVWLGQGARAAVEEAAVGGVPKVLEKLEMLERELPEVKKMADQDEMRIKRRSVEEEVIIRKCQGLQDPMQASGHRILL